LCGVAYMGDSSRLQVFVVRSSLRSTDTEAI
jgi:hypothetical protein